MPDKNDYENIGEALDALGDTLKRPLEDLVNALKWCQSLSDGHEGHGDSMAVYKKAVSEKRERLLLRYTVGEGIFDESFTYNYLNMTMFNLDGTSDGDHDGVWEPQVDPEEFLELPRRSRGPVDRPEGPINAMTVRAWTNARWRFGKHRKDAVYAEGPANLLLVPLSDGATMFLVSVAAIITDGEGKFEGARGVKTAIGSTFVEKGKSLFDFRPPAKIGAVTVETFRIVNADDIA